MTTVVAGVWWLIVVHTSPWVGYQPHLSTYATEKACLERQAYELERLATLRRTIGPHYWGVVSPCQEAKD